jgi:chloramphenicol-sensitive protein RarD
MAEPAISAHGPAVDVLLLLGCGVVTAVPLMIYANGAKLLRLSTIGIMQYIAPTMIFFIAVFVFKEPFGPYKLAAFVLIWIALGNLYVIAAAQPARAAGGSRRNGCQSAWLKR